MIESMCVVCHGPITQGRLGPRSTTCNRQCRNVMKRYRRGSPLRNWYQDIRMLQAYRRELEHVEREMVNLFGRVGVPYASLG